jgi:hypothetical protein
LYKNASFRREKDQYSPVCVNEKPESKALSSGELCWRRGDVAAAFQGLARDQEVILGFDILEFIPDGKIVPWGTSAYHMDDLLDVRPWKECVEIALDLALRDVERTRALTGDQPSPEAELWYCVASTTEEKHRDATFNVPPEMMWRKRAPKLK